MPEPFFKYVGGKRAILTNLLFHVPRDFGAYHEPMVGGGALFWRLASLGRLEGKAVYLSDMSEGVIKAYTDVRDDVEKVIRTLRRLETVYLLNPETVYYRTREEWNAGKCDAARFIFLKQTAFNGLWRCNKRGSVNMPWGKYPKPKFADAEQLRRCSAALQNAAIKMQSYNIAAKQCAPGDLVYFDPPYFGCFSSYTRDGFANEEQEWLMRVCANLCERGVQVIYTNVDCTDVRELRRVHWPWSYVERAATRRSVNRDGGGRKVENDLIVSGPVREKHEQQLPLFVEGVANG